MKPAGTMISRDMAEGRFNLRAAAIILREGRVLLQRAVSDSFWALPGGRVEWGETARQTVAREIEEELGVVGAVGELRFVMERFFGFDGHRFHELAYYFPVTLPGSFPFPAEGEICHRVVDGGAEIEFKWVEAETESLAAHRFVPPALRGLLLAGEGTIRHIVESE